MFGLPVQALAAAGFLLSGATAWADPPAPINILAPPPASAPPPAYAPPPSIEPQDVAVERQDLAAPAGESAGVLDARQGGFPPTLWSGTSVVTVRALLGHLPLAVDSPTLRALARRLLLSQASPPKGAVDGDRPSLVELRVQRLLALGAYDGAVDLAAAAPAPVRGPFLAPARVEGLLLEGRMDTACAEVAAAGSSVAMTKTQILCQLAAGNSAGNLGLDLLRDWKPADTAFIAAAEVVGGLPLAKGGIPSLRDPSTPQLAALAAAKIPLPADAVDSASPAALRSIALASATPPEIRLAAAERAEAVGVLDIELLRRQIAAIDLTPEDLAKADTAPGARGLALLARSAAAVNDPALQAALLGRAFDQAAARGRYPTAARLLAPLVAGVPAQPALAAFAPVAARALLVAGRPEAAQPWLDLAGRDPEGAKAVLRLWPLARVAGLGDSSAFAAWRPTVEPKRAMLVAALLSGLGSRIPDSELAALLDAPGGGGPAPALALQLDAAIRDQSLGGVVLATLASFETGGLDKTDPLTLARVMGGLKSVGLEAEARRLAVEILLANGM